MGTNFWSRFAQHNAPFLVNFFRELSNQIELLVPGSPVFVYPILFKQQGEFSMSDITVSDVETGLTAGPLTFADAEGNPTAPDDIPVWSSSDESVATITPAEDGLTASFVIGAPGASLITVMSTNAAGDELTVAGTITVLPGDAASIGDLAFNVPAAPAA